MTREDLNKIVTVEDLNELFLSIKKEFENLKNQREFYSPKEFSERTGVKYRTVIRNCNNGLYFAHQEVDGGSWLIHKSEITKLIEAAKNNNYKNKY
jgi:hypothetical protein